MAVSLRVYGPQVMTTLWEDALPTSDTQLERISKLEQLARALDDQDETPTNQVGHEPEPGRMDDPSFMTPD